MTQKLEAGITDHLQSADIGTTGQTVVVTKQGEDGGITLDGFTGVVLRTAGDELPEWSEGLTQALLAERHIFYSSRLGGLYTDELKFPDTIAFEDLGWIHVSELNEPLETQPEVRDLETGAITQHALYDHVELNTIDANHEFRMERISDITGIAGDIDLEEGTFGKDAITQAISRDNQRTAEELASMEQAKQEGFGKVAEG